MTKKHKNYTDSSSLDSVFTKYVPIVCTANDSGNIYSVYITKPIGETHNYDELVYLLTHSVQENDIVHMYLSTPGGYINSTMYVIDAMIQCTARVIGILNGCVASAGTILTMACDDIIVPKYSSMMIHNYRGGYFGAAHEIEMDFKFTHPHTQQFMRDIYEGFLTDEECTTVFSGQDKYLSATEITARWAVVMENRAKYHNQLQADEIKGSLPIIEEELALIGYKAIPIDIPESKQSRKQKTVKQV